ncbi:Cytochrome c-type biogenesis protein CcmE [Dirofilaria immitis]
MDSLKFGLTISSLSYHPDYSRLSLHNLIVIAGALVNITIMLLAIIILYIMRPEILSAIEEEQISQISSNKKRLIKLSPVEGIEKLEKVWQFHPIEISATSTNSKTGEEPIFTQINGADDYLKNMPELPPYMTHVGDDKPVVFYVKEGKPEVAILPVYVMKDNGNHLVSPATILKTSPPQPKELVRLHTASTETTTTRSSSRKKESATSSLSQSSSNMKSDNFDHEL